jgi:Kelch motif
MTMTDDLERQLHAMLADAAPRREPEGLYAAVLASTRSARQRPGVLVTLRRGDLETAPRASIRLAPALLIGLLITALAGALAIVGSQLLAPPRTAVPGFIPTGPLTVARADATAVRLADGRVLIVGGWTTDGTFPGLASAEIYDPDTGTFAATGPMHEGRVSPSATLLADGRVLVAGGFPFESMTVAPATGLTSAEIYDPRTGTFSSTGPLAEGRGDHAAVRIPSGEVLVVGGVGGLRSTGTDSAELIEPSHLERFHHATGVFTRDAIPNFTGTTDALVLGDGRILGFGPGWILNYDPVRIEGHLIEDPGWVAAGVTLLRDGRIAVVGSAVDETGVGVRLFDPATDRFSPVAVVAPGGSAPAGEPFAVFETPDARVLIIGRSWPDAGDQILSVELYDPATGAVVEADPMSDQPLGGRFTATPLLDGSVLVAGGATSPTGQITPLGAASLWVSDVGTR